MNGTLVPEKRRRIRIRSSTLASSPTGDYPSATMNTSNDTYVATLPAPTSAYAPIQTDPNVPAQPPPQNPVFLFTAQ